MSFFYFLSFVFSSTSRPEGKKLKKISSHRKGVGLARSDVRIRIEHAAVRLSVDVGLEDDPVVRDAVDVRARLWKGESGVFFFFFF